ncbi:glycosyltransferase [Devosia sp. Leaf64]|uniref:glycosyltransferase family 2 protein n=1 Tax=Devosia sp. Leaf64 TaxID=1736229 RepID=UPI000A51F315|nr:glycosyltransferase [Devosia sp. Leaf64]
MFQNNLVSIVMRTVGERPREIRRALESVLANNQRPLEIIIVYQGSDDERWTGVQLLSGEFPDLQVHAIRNAGLGDRRAESLNIGWDTAKGRYVGFLDDDDTLEPSHVELLQKAIEGSGRAWAYAQVVLRREDEALQVVSETRPFRRLAFSLKALWEENFLPIHSFLIDRNRLHVSLRYRPFCEDLDRSEDWDFLLRLAFYHEPAVVEDFTATYYVSTGSRNTNLSLTSGSADEERKRHNLQAWERCKLLVEQRKGMLIAPFWWAQDYFSFQTRSPEEDVPTQAPHRMFRQRVVRKLIRILERWL